MRIPIYKYSVDWYNKESVVRKWWMLPKWWMFIVEISFFDKFLNGIIAISKLLYEHYENIGVSKKKLILIPNIIDIQSFSKIESVDKVIKGEKLFRIGFCGAALLLNGVDDLIKAFKIVHEKHLNTELLIVGDVVGGSQLPILKTIAEKQNVRNSVIFTGRVQGRKIPDYLATCDILVLARKNTHFAQAGFPTKLGEYFVSKRPVVMTDVGDITDYFTHKEELMIAQPDSSASVALNIIYLLEHNNERKKMAQNGYNWAKTNLDYISTSKKIIKFMIKNK